MTGLKKANDTKGHQEGDRLILRACESLRSVFAGFGLYRIGGDEFLAICPEIEEAAFYDKIDQLRKKSLENDVILAVGASWALSSSVDKLISESETRMYEDKSLYYRSSGEDRRKR